MRFPQFLAALLSPLAAGAQDLPLLIDLKMEPVAGAEKKIADSGPHKIESGLAPGVSFVADGKRGSALHFSGEGTSRAKFDPKIMGRVGAPLSITLWVKREGAAKEGTVAVMVTKRTGWWTGTPFSLQMHADGSIEAAGLNGRDWNQVRSKPIKDKTWTHVAWTCGADEEMVLYIDGAAVARKKFTGELAGNDQPFVLGNEDGGNFPGGGRSPFRGALDELRMFAAVLTPEQVQAEMRGELAGTRAAKKEDFAPQSHAAGLRLVRWDAPLGYKGRNEMTRLVVKRVPGPDAVDWPRFTLGGKPLWEKDGDEVRALKLRTGNPEAYWATQQSYDDVIEPGGHWLRALQWMWGHRSIYTSDATARGSGKDYELFTFPVLLAGKGDADVRDVKLSVGGETIYENAGPLRSLTLLVPQNAPGKPYELSVAGQTAKFEAGLQPIVAGDPREAPIAIQAVLGAVTVSNGAPVFPHADDWEKDLSALAAARSEKLAREADPDAVPLLASYAMEPGEKDRTADSGALAIGGALTEDAKLVDGGKTGQALQLDGKKARLVMKAGKPITDADAVSFAAWIQPAELPKGDRTFIVTTRPAWWEGSFPFALALNGDGSLELGGGGWAVKTKGGVVKAGEWQHLGFALTSGGEALVLRGGEIVARGKAPSLKRNQHPLVLGYEEGGNFPGGKYVGYHGLMDDVRFFGAALTAEQMAAEMAGTLKTRTATKGKSPLAAPFTLARETKKMRDFLGIEVPRSPIAIHTVSMTHGMSGGHMWGSAHGPGPGFDNFSKGGAFDGSLEDYAKLLADTGYDRVFEQLDEKGTPEPRSAKSYEAWLAALAAHGIQGGLNLTQLRDSNLAFYAHNLADWRAPLYRAVQLTTQRFARFPNYAGGTIGADNAGYSVFWDWAPVSSERPWGEAFETFQRGQTGPEPLRIPLSPAMGRDWRIMEKNPTTQRAFIDYLDRYDATFAQSYGYFARASAEIDPALAFTNNSFGSSAGGGGRGGWSGTMSGDAMFAGTPVLQSYDWDETECAKPLHNFALIDRLRSTFPDKPAWALVDHFFLKYGREARQRAFSLLLTRGLDSIGPNWIAHTNGKWARPKTVADEKELYAWIHKYGGAYALTEPQAAIGVLYVHEQSMSLKDPGEKEEEKGREGAHEGKTTEALLLCHAAGWPAKLVTPAELKRGLPEGMSALLLVGLPRIDKTWNWWEASALSDKSDLTPALAAFVKKGGRVLLDNQSIAPESIPATKTGMRVRAYVPQGLGGAHKASLDRTPDILAREAENIPKLQAAMAGAPAPVCTTGEAIAWAVPTIAGDVQYVTVVNEASTPGKNMTAHFTPHTTTLTWTTDRAIYDVRLGKKLTADEAKKCDLTKDAFQYYALPPRAPTTPTVQVAAGKDGFLVAQIESGKMRGVPIELKLTRGEETVTLHTATGLDTKLPLRSGDAGEVKIEATELLSGLRGATRATPPATRAPSRDTDHLAAFRARKSVPLVLALTPEQHADPAINALAKKLAAHFAQHGRTLTARKIAPGDLIVSLQAGMTSQRFPQWQTIPADLILLGDPTTNLLLLDQARGHLLSPDAKIAVTFSPFVGEYHALNLVANTPAALAALVDSLGTGGVAR